MNVMTIKMAYIIIRMATTIRIGNLIIKIGLFTNNISFQ